MAPREARQLTVRYEVCQVSDSDCFTTWNLVCTALVRTSSPYFRNPTLPVSVHPDTLKYVGCHVLLTNRAKANPSRGGDAKLPVWSADVASDSGVAGKVSRESRAPAVIPLSPQIASVL